MPILLTNTMSPYLRKMEILTHIMCPTASTIPAVQVDFVPLAVAPGLPGELWPQVGAAPEHS